MTYTGLEFFMENLKQMICNNNNPLINNPEVLSQRPQLQQLYDELGSMIQTLFIHQHHHVTKLEKVQNLKKRFKDAAEEAQDIIDLFLSAVHFRNRGLSPRSDVFKTSLNLEYVMRSIESIKLEFMTINIDNMKMDRTENQQMQSAARTACTRNRLGTRKVLEDIIVGLEDDTKVIVERLIEDRKKLDVVSIVGMGGLGKTTLATKVFKDPYVVHHFHVRAWATVSQTYEKGDVLVQILAWIGVEQGLEKASDSQLREKLHKHLMGRRYLIVIDDIWSKDAWDDLINVLPDNNTSSRVLLTSRHKEVASYAKAQGFIHFLGYMTEKQSWELLCKKVFHDDECPKWAIIPGNIIAKKCQGLPLSLVVIAGVLAKEAMSKDFWVEIACSVSSYIASAENMYLETFVLSYHHLPRHLRECFLYLGGFPEDFMFSARRLIWLWVAEGFIQEDGNRSLEDIAEARLTDLVDRNLLIVTKRKSHGGVKAFKVHDIVRKLCLKKAEEERFFLNIYTRSSGVVEEVRFFQDINGRPLINGRSSGVVMTPPSGLVRTPSGVFRTPPSGVVMTPYKQGRIFTDRDIYIVNFAHPHTPIIRSLLFSHKTTSSFYYIAEYFRSFTLLRVLDLQQCELIEFPEGIALLVHLRYLAIWHLLGFPSSICNLWNLQTLLIKTSHGSLFLPSNISDLVNLRNLWSNNDLYLLCIEKPMNLQTISKIILGDGVENFKKCFPSVKKLATSLFPDKEHDFELLLFLDTLKVFASNLCKRKSNDLNHFFHATLKKLTLVRCYLTQTIITIISLLPNLEVLKLSDCEFEGLHWNTSEQQFLQLKFLRLKSLNIKQWDAYNSNFPCLRRLTLWDCDSLEEIPLEIGNISTLELIEIDGLNKSVVESVKKIQKEQVYEGNTELKITVDGMELSFYVSQNVGLMLDM